MVDSDDAEVVGGGRRSKVARLLQEYGLDGVGAELERAWTADGEERRSLRELADEFNRHLLEATMVDTGMEPLEGELENVYRLLTDDSVTEGHRTRVRRQLEYEGVDVDALLDDFVTYQAIRTYLREYRGAEYERSDGSRTDVERERIERLRGRTAAVTEGKLEGLRDGGHLALEAFQSIVEISVVCESCGTQHDVSALLEAGGCDCLLEDE